MRNQGGAWRGGQVPCPISYVSKGCPSPEGENLSCSPGRIGMSQLTQPAWETKAQIYNLGWRFAQPDPPIRPLQLDALLFYYQEF